MSKLSRYNLLISLVRSELRYEHTLGKSNSAITHNRLLIDRSIEAWVFLAEDLMCENELSLQARDTRISNLIKFINAHRIELTLKALKYVYDLLIDHISTKNVLSDYADFKGRITHEMGTSIGVLLSPIKESIASVLTSETVFSTGCYRSKATRHMWICAHYLQFLNKINFEDVGLEEKALADYYIAEEETASFDVSRCSHLIPAIQNILKGWLDNWDYDGFNPKHGPGSVADSERYKVDKYFNLSVDDKIRYLYQSDHPAILPSWHKQSFQRMSKLVFVPKNITKLRSISMEPATLQYIQQGCMDSLYNYFREHQQLRHILKLEDQHQNKSFAYHGSITDDYATIDLSHASDSVNWKLTKLVFRRVPKLLKWLVCTRSTHTLLPDGVELSLTKFAPMGSALCFPIESLIFAAIAKLSVTLAREQALDRDVSTGIRSNIKSITVYGDDIIVPRYAASICIDLLKLFGFSPNNEKSYLEGPFKESCGGNYFCGYDITPIKYAPKFDTTSNLGVSASAYTALCSYANLAYSRGLFLFRLYCIKLIFEAGYSPLFTESLNKAPAIYSPAPTNFHLKKVYRKRYQKYQYMYTGTTEVELSYDKQSHLDEEIFLFDKLLTLSKRKEICHLPLLNAKLIDNGQSLIFDINAPYSRKTLLPRETRFTLCFEDI